MNRTHVVVGGGTSGIVLVNLLLNAGDDVILIEQGKSDIDTHPDIRQTGRWGDAAMRPKTSETGVNMLTEPIPALQHRQLMYPQGFGLGGTSNINACIFSAGSAATFNSHWPVNWNAFHVQRWLSKAQAVLGPTRIQAAGVAANILDSATEWVGTNPRRSKSSVNAEFVADDLLWAPARTNAYLTAVTAAQSSSRALLSNGLRMGSPHAGRLTLMTDTRAEFVRFDGLRAVAVAVIGTAHEAAASTALTMVHPVGGGEIVLCCGAVLTPRLLVASGLFGAAYVHPASNMGRVSVPPVGDLTKAVPARIARRSAELRSALPVLSGIGQGLQDHPILPVLALGSWNIDSTKNDANVGVAATGGWCGWLTFLLWTLWGDLLSLRFWAKPAQPRLDHLDAPPQPPNGVHGWLLLDDSGAPIPADSSQEPTVQLLFCDGSCGVGMFPELLLPRWADSRVWSEYIRPILYIALAALCSLKCVRILLKHYVFGFLVCLVRPHSRGKLTFQSAGAVPALDLGLLADPRDVAALHAAVQTARAVLENSRQHTRLQYLELLPGTLFQYALPWDSYQNYVATFLTTYFHACGTCGMSVEPSTKRGLQASKAVVDSHLRVLGVHGLRLADASVFPCIPTAPTAATCMAVGAAAAEFILQDRL